MKRPFIKEPVRARIVLMLKRGHTYQEVADAFTVGFATVNRIWRRYRETGQTSLPPRGGGQPPAISAERKQELTSFVEQRPTATYAELATEWAKKTKTKISRSAMIRHVLAAGFTRKKISKRAEQKKTKKNRAKRASFRHKIKSVAAEKLVFLDEAGFQAGLYPVYGRSLKGKPACFSMPATYHKNITQVGAIRLSGPVVMRGSRFAMTNLKFKAFLRSCLLPRLRVDDVLVLDNLRPHRQKAVRQIARRAGVKVIYLPPYSPELNPIEYVWSVMKNRLRRRVNRASRDFRYAVAGAWRKISKLCFDKLFASCGYVLSGHAI